MLLAQIYTCKCWCPSVPRLPPCANLTFYPYTANVDSMSIHPQFEAQTTEDTQTNVACVMILVVLKVVGKRGALQVV